MTAGFDAAVVGAGPAGAWTAYGLARAGARVALIDASHPREKPCGGGVTARAFALLGPAVRFDPGDFVAVEGAGFEAGRGRSRVPLTGDVLRVVSRRLFDARLLAAAVTAGAEHLPARVIDIGAEPGGWRLRTGAGDVRATWLIGADGANSLVRRRLSRPFSRRDLSIASGYFVHGATSAEIEIGFIGRPPGYLWSFPRPDHLAIGACAQADVTTSAELLEYTAGWIRDRVPGGVSLQRYSWPVPSLHAAALAADCPAGPGWMLVGDAAGLVDPITREGIFFALRSAALAAASLVRGRPAEYVPELRREVHAELIRAARLKRQFFGPRFTSLLVRALERSPRVRRVMADLIAGEQTYGGLRRRLLSTCEWRLLVELLRLERAGAAEGVTAGAAN